MTAQEQLSNEEFIQRLTKLFESSSKSHSVFVTHKRVALTGTSSASSNETHAIVVRATDGCGTSKSGRTKFTTHVEPTNLKAFQDSYSVLLRSSTVGFLRKRDKGKERRADKLLKEKRKRIEEVKEGVKVTAIGSKRGAGRRKRQQARKKAQTLRRERIRAQAASTTKASGGALGGGSGAAAAAAK